MADSDAPEPARKPVLYAKGALYGYCPKCAAPGEMRLDGNDRCQRKHTYKSTEAKETPK